RLESPQIFAQRLSAAGVPQWTANGVSVCTATSFQPAAAFAGSATAIIGWQDYRNGLADIYAQKISAGEAQRAADGVPVCSAANAQVNTAIVSDGSGGAILGWEDSRTADRDFFAQRLDTNGSPLWAPDGVSLCGAAGGRYGLTMVADFSGGAIAAWSDLRSGTNYDIYAQRVDASSARLWGASGTPVCVSGGDQIVPMIVNDGTGGADLAWTDLRNGVFEYDVYAARIISAGGVLGVSPGVSGSGAFRLFPNPSSGAIALSF